MLSVIFILVIILLVAFLLIQNMRDEKKFEKGLNEEDEHPIHPPVDEEKRM